MYIDIYIWIFILGIGSWDLEAKKSHDLPSGSWRARKASGIIQSESECQGVRVWKPGVHWCKLKGLRTGGHGISPSPNPEGPRARSTNGQKQRKINVLTGVKKKKRKSPFFHLMVYSRFPWIGWCPSIEGLSSLLSLPIQILISFASTLTDTLINNVSSGICIP